MRREAAPDRRATIRQGITLARTRSKRPAGSWTIRRRSNGNGQDDLPHHRIVEASRATPWSNCRHQASSSMSESIRAKRRWNTSIPTFSRRRAP
jgi:hypothetical protein